ncbi:uncharacterized protein LOC106166269 [Lingula anatina]|uniref:Uncharacterized protein LOC106166269 n=1 Tax=Lingula anatina TaxID=7574 RepID=A0A1S3IPR9_LINAN|nr:uncharacterized protein LOC106166269 [Lingula anatina]|eukprot:XP_013400215.1 uncharacterized protein LOC106166269 [Lingula anatina]
MRSLQLVILVFIGVCLSAAVDGSVEQQLRTASLILSGPSGESIRCGVDDRAQQSGCPAANAPGAAVRASSISAAAAPPRVPNANNPPPERVTRRTKRQIAHSGTSECQEWCKFVRPYKIWAYNRWWNVVQTNNFAQWLKFCFCSQNSQECVHYPPGQNVNPSQSRQGLCAKCTTEWGWRTVWVWHNCQPLRIWYQIPVGCCCGLVNARWCTMPPWSFPWNFKAPWPFKK